LPRIDIEVFAHLAGRSVDQTEKDLQRRLQKAGYDAGRNYSNEFQRGLNTGPGLGSLTRDMERLTAARRGSTEAERQFARDTASFENAMTRRTRAIREFEAAHRSLQRSSGGGGGRGGGGFGNSLGNAFGSIPFVPGGAAGAAIGTGLITGLGAIAEAVTTASQALWTLPAAAAAAGAGFATLKIGMSGFDKALKDMGDPKKFAEDLAKISPSAQQAALEIQHLASGLGGFKKSIQEALFSGVAPQLHNLANAFLPQLHGMFAGIAGSFNTMFTGAVGQLTGGSRGDVNNVIANIVKAFQALSPAMAPVVDAFTKIAQVGSTFLPGFGQSITDAAKAFDNFITKAQQTGQLRHWIQQGLDAAKALGNFLGELAHKFYDVFGNKSPQQFADTLHGVVSTLTVIGQAMVGLSNAVNSVVRALNPVASMVGGWPNLIRDVVIAWGTWKVGGLIADLFKVETLLGTALPAAAESGAARIAAAFGALAAPMAFYDLLATGGNNDPATDPFKHAIKKDGIDTVKAKGDALDAFGKDWQKTHGKDSPIGGGKAFLDSYNNWVAGKGPIPDQLKPFYHPPAAPGAPAGQWGPSSPGWNDSWWGNAPNSAGMAPWAPYDVPGVPGKGGVGKDKAATPFGPGYAAPPRPGETEQEYSAEGEVLNARHRLEEDRATLLALQKDNNASAEQKQAAENKLAEDQRAIYEAQMRLTDAQQNAYKQQLKGLKSADDEFNNIDQDFGLSKGLPGLVKNLIGMIGDLAAAPMMGQLKALAAASGTDKNTFGAFGMMGQQNLAAGRSPILGIGAGQPGGPGLGLAGFNPAGMLSDYGLPAGANIYTGPHTEDTHGALVPRAAALRNLIQQRFGVTNIGGYRQPDGYNEHSSGEALDIMVGGNQTLGDQINQFLQANASALGLQYDLWRQQQWTPGQGPSAMADRGSPTQNHMDHVHARLVPGAIAPAGLGAPGGAYPSMGGPQAQLTGFGQPDPSAPPTPLGPPRGGGWQPQGGGGNGVGGLPLAAAMTAASMFPGGGAAAQTAMQLMNRTIGYGQQVGAIAAQGLMDTFKISSPDGDDGGKSDLSQGWFGRVAAGFAGARPAIPSGAGSAPKAKKDSNPTDDPTGKGALGQDGDTTHNNYGGTINYGTMINGGQPQPGMGETNASLSAAASAPAPTSMGGFI
jgi:hypothetical protein